MSNEILKVTRSLIEPILAEHGLSLFDLEYVKEGNDYFLRVFIDKPSGVDLSECEFISEAVSEVLDKKEPIKDAYYLEVSSPGAERPLRTKEEIAERVGENVFVTLYMQIDGEKEYEGILTEFTNDVVTIEYKFKTRVKQVQIPYEKIAKARLAVVL